MAKLKPLAGYVLIEPLDEQETTASGLALPEKAQEKPEKGKVLGVGHYTDFDYGKTLSAQSPEELATFNIDKNLKEGDIVVFHKWSGQDVREGNKEYKLVKFSDLMGVYENS